MGELSDFWQQMDAARQRARAEQDATKSVIEDIVCLGGKWRFVGVREGSKWIARHRYEGELIAATSAALIEKVKAAVEKRSVRR